MKLWTMLAGLAVAGILVSSTFAQDAPAPAKNKGKGPRGGRMAATYEKIVAADVGVKDGDAVTLDAFTKYLEKNVPKDAPEGTADRIKNMAPRAFGRLATLAGKDASVTSLDKDDYIKGQKAQAANAGKGKKSDDAAPAPAPST